MTRLELICEIERISLKAETGADFAELVELQMQLETAPEGEDE